MAPDVEASGPSCGLLTDHYELTMVEAALGSGVVHHRAVFEVFARGLPPGRRYGVVAGTGRLVETLADFSFGRPELDWLARARVVGDRTLEWLADYRFTGTITGYREGELFFPGSPILTVDAPFGEALVLETLVLSVLNHDCAVAAAGSRMVNAAGGRPLVEAGGRRTHEWAAPAAARAAWLVGFTATSNLEAGRRWGIPTAGTTAHAFTLAHADEAAAFRAQLAALGSSTTLLVDTFDIPAGIERAIAEAGPGLGAIRIDSGDLAVEARRARTLLDRLGATRTRIVTSGDLDEWRIAALSDAPVDAMLVGTQLVVGSGAPTAGLVYKLVAVAREPGRDAPLEPVAKRSVGKATRGGAKAAFRRLLPSGRAEVELVSGLAALEPGAWTTVPAAGDTGGASRLRPLQVVLVDAGAPRLGVLDLAAARRHHQRCLEELPPEALRLDAGEPALAVVDADRPG
jgi:nicotinate phosphoribosyltransferase